MNRRFVGTKALAFGLSLVAGGMVVSLPLLAIAQQYMPPPRGIPGRREGAGTRGPQDSCMQGTQGVKTLMPLVPGDRYGATVSKTPIFFVYVPQTVAKAGEFRLIDSADQPLFVGTMPLSGNPGVVSYQLPRSAADQLQTGKDYRWQFSLLCNTAEPSVNPFVEGIVQRDEPTPALRKDLSTAKTTRDRASVYAAAGIWHEAIATLAKLRCDRPADPQIQTSWHTLLNSVGLNDFAKEPIAESCPTLNSPTP